ncbi:DUF2867 domain-containing protein [Streptomyces sp. GXMU-J5]|uniref:DUF2867 domain-containing protein n=1 Tax=Streptomyces beihaiensis TaxID=2984495 RepID=A0ABT3TRT0_9ACTN|nr:DUF2867 domain-containing protein [Streptomyces beihaiensis]MCX3059206.1 DUF2867 domain-containing protein [Streptomyces beihaiensis]
MRATAPAAVAPSEPHRRPSGRRGGLRRDRPAAAPCGTGRPPPHAGSPDTYPDRDPHRLRVGDSLDFWRVEALEPKRLLRLRAEMRLPGLAWLEMRVDRDEAGRTHYRQRALFCPRGLLGHAYWWSVSPFHAVVFGGMARNIVRAAAAGATGPGDGRADAPVPVRQRPRT